MSQKENVRSLFENLGSGSKSTDLSHEAVDVVRLNNIFEKEANFGFFENGKFTPQWLTKGLSVVNISINIY